LWKRLLAEPPALAAAACDPVSDQRGSADYKRHCAGVLVERVLRRATARALGKSVITSRDGGGGT
jgi:aerobic carbon-monoxide dehydrogenase medium subunit